MEGPWRGGRSFDPGRMMLRGLVPLPVGWLTGAPPRDRPARPDACPDTGPDRAA